MSNPTINLDHTRGNYCVALIGGTNWHHMMSRVQKVISKLEEWGLTCGLSFNPSKTEVVICTKNNLVCHRNQINYR